MSLIGERGNVLELYDRGESTPFTFVEALACLLVALDGARLAPAEAVGAVVCVFARLRFFWTVRLTAPLVNTSASVSELEIEAATLFSGSLFSLSDIA